jgi:hypothetical protein
VERGFAEGLHRTLADRTAQATAAGISGPLAKLVRRGQQAGEIRSDLNADEVAALAVNLLVVRVLTRDEPPQASSTSVFDLLLYGVAGTDSPRRPAPGSRRRPR